MFGFAWLVGCAMVCVIFGKRGTEGGGRKSGLRFSLRVFHYVAHAEWSFLVTLALAECLRLWRRRFYCQSCGGSGCGAGSGLSEGKVVIARLDGDASL